MTIHTKTVFVTLGQQFDTLKRAIRCREDAIEEFLRKLPGYREFPAKHTTAFIQAIIDNRSALSALLDYSDTLEQSEDD